MIHTYLCEYVLVFMISLLLCVNVFEVGPKSQNKGQKIQNPKSAVGGLGGWLGSWAVGGLVVLGVY